MLEAEFFLVVDYDVSTIEMIESAESSILDRFLVWNHNNDFFFFVLCKMMCVSPVGLLHLHLSIVDWLHKNVFV